MAAVLVTCNCHLPGAELGVGFVALHKEQPLSSIPTLHTPRSLLCMSHHTHQSLPSVGRLAAGVLNTDNMSILGDTIGERPVRRSPVQPTPRTSVSQLAGFAVTLNVSLAHVCRSACLLMLRLVSTRPSTDYGPYGFMERFDPDFTPNTTDLPGRRYCFR